MSAAKLHQQQSKHVCITAIYCSQWLQQHDSKHVCITGCTTASERCSQKHSHFHIQLPAKQTKFGCRNSWQSRGSIMALDHLFGWCKLLQSTSFFACTCAASPNNPSGSLVTIIHAYKAEPDSDSITCMFHRCTWCQLVLCGARFCFCLHVAVRTFEHTWVSED